MSKYTEQEAVAISTTNYNRALTARLLFDVALNSEDRAYSGEVRLTVTRDLALTRAEEMISSIGFSVGDPCSDNLLDDLLEEFEDQQEENELDAVLDELEDESEDFGQEAQYPALAELRGKIDALEANLSDLRNEHYRLANRS